MKYLAHTSSDINSPIVSIYEAQVGSQADYYSLCDLTPMIAKLGYRRRAPHFAFKSGYAGVGTGESVEHSITKYVIYRSKTLHLRSENGSGSVVFDDMRIEYRFAGGLYVADLYGRVLTDTILGLNSGDWLVVEICKTHRVDRVKRDFFVTNGIAAIEIKYWSDIKFERSEIHFQRRVEGWLSRPQYFRWLHNPSGMAVIDDSVNFADRLAAKLAQSDAAMNGCDVASSAPVVAPVVRSNSGSVITPASANARPRRPFLQRLRQFFSAVR